MCGISSCFLIKHIGKNAKSLCKLHYDYRNGISTYHFNTLWLLDSRRYMIFVTPFFQPDFYAVGVLFRNMLDVEKIYANIFAEKMWVAFAATHSFSAKIPVNKILCLLE